MSELLHFWMDDIHYPSDNDFEIPVLDPALQAFGAIGNFRIWGNGARKTPRPGDTYAFYCPDYRFTALIKHPEAIPLSQCAAIVEPNFSTSSRMPLPVAMYGIFLKRKITRYAQTFGIKSLVDLTVDPKFAALNLQGVPAGWQSFAIRATRYFGESFLLDNWKLAQQHSGLEHPAFVVYGGGKTIEALTQEYHWDWEPEVMSKHSKSQIANGITSR